jgi:predicted RNA-binding protein with PUA-like domain
MRYWLVKSEEDVYSIHDLKRDKETHWHGVRNYQARNFLKDMKKGDRVAYYHSNCELPGVVGTAKVSREAYPDPSQFDSASEYFDKASTPAEPRWYCPNLKFEEAFKVTVSLEQLKAVAVFRDSQLIKKGNRLSVMPLSGAQFMAIEKLANQKMAAPRAKGA